MTPGESIQIRAAKTEIVDEVAILRSENNERFDRIETSIAPALLLAQRFAIAGDIAVGTARIVKWGVGIGAGIATVYVALHAAALV